MPEKRTLEPGTIEHTRKNIGAISNEEANRMIGILGGEILSERSVPIDTRSMPKRAKINEVIRPTGRTSADIASQSAALSSTSNNKPTASVDKIVESTTRRIKTEAELPAITSKNLKAMNKLMMSVEYGIKPNYGLLNFIFQMSAKNKEKVLQSFANYSIKKHVEHMQNFVGTIKTFIQIAPDTYKSKIATEGDMKFKFLRTVGKWNLKDVKTLAIDIENGAADMSVAQMIPFIKAVYRQLITIYYIGDQQVPSLVKEVYADLITYTDMDKKKCQLLAKEVITEWIYIYNQIIKGLYPLLMRMCTSEFVTFPQFFTTKIGDILAFLGMTKFELLLPEKKKKSLEQIQKEKQEAIKKAEEERNTPGRKDEIVATGIKILEQLFPEAGFSRLNELPDMYPYFQPLYKFQDGFNMLSPKNGLQVTVVLLRILEDCFQGLRNVKFNFDNDEKISQMKDSISSILNDWTMYREILFQKKYGDYLRNFVNSLYSQPDYAKSQYGKEALQNMNWMTRAYFLPHYEFTLFLLEKPVADKTTIPLCRRTDFVRKAFTIIARRIDENAAAKKPVLGVTNPWDRYVFDIPNNVSKRLDVLLGAKKTTDTAATNANLIKYTLCIMAVLDWWVNNPDSPAYNIESKQIYRINDEDGGPSFSAPLRNDQNQLFAAAIKKALAAKMK